MPLPSLRRRILTPEERLLYQMSISPSSSVTSGLEDWQVGCTPHRSPLPPQCALLSPQVTETSTLPLNSPWAQPQSCISGASSPDGGGTPSGSPSQSTSPLPPPVPFPTPPRLPSF